LASRAGKKKEKKKKKKKEKKKEKKITTQLQSLYAVLSIWLAQERPPNQNAPSVGEMAEVFKRHPPACGGPGCRKTWDARWAGQEHGPR
jgi:hypothetical protein